MGITTFTSTITDDALGHVIHQLSTLYSDPMTAVLREYITNGLDAHQDSGTTRPIKVSLPSATHPTLSIRDFGDGLDTNGLQTVFFNYGSSTKRDTNERIGSLGFGAKSAFSVSDSWRVRSIHQGKLYQVSSSKTTSGLPVQRVLIDGATVDQSTGADEYADGIEIQIDVDVQKFHPSDWVTKLRQVALWLPKDSVSLSTMSGPEIMTTWEVDPRFTPAPFGSGKIILHSDSDPTPFVVMGGVSYRLNQSFQRAVMDYVVAHESELGMSLQNLHHMFGLSRDKQLKFIYGASTVIYAMGVFVPMGSVPFAPNREEIIATPEAVMMVGDIVVTELAGLFVEMDQLSRLPVETRLWEVARFMHAMRAVRADNILTTTGIPLTTKLISGTAKPKNVEFLSLGDLLSNTIPHVGSPYASGHKNYVLITSNDRQRIPYADAFLTYLARDVNYHLAMVHTEEANGTGNEFLDAALGLVFPKGGTFKTAALLNTPESTGQEARVYTYDEYLAEVREIRRIARANGQVPERRDDTMSVFDNSIPGSGSTERMSYSQVAALAQEAQVPVYYTRTDDMGEVNVRLPAGIYPPEGVVVLLGKRRKPQTLDAVLTTKELPDSKPVGVYMEALAENVRQWLHAATSEQDADAMTYFMTFRWGSGFGEVERSLVLLGLRILDSAHHTLLSDTHPILSAARKVRRGKELWADLSEGLESRVADSVVRMATYRLHLDTPTWINDFPLALQHVRLLSSTDDARERSRIIEHLTLYLAVTG